MSGSTLASRTVPRMRAAEEAWIAADFPTDHETIGRIMANAIAGTATTT